MDLNAHVAHWKRGAIEDLETARILFDKARYGYCLFFVHLALEKMLKARVIQHTGDFAPKIHNLGRLIELAGIVMDAEEQKAYVRYNRYCTMGRYADLEQLPVQKEEAHERLLDGEKKLKWLQNL